ncbi:MAG: hypothetical protein CVV21_06170 [Candidatus Goldiibacteriota bacterium HGW-Goldbacteria-1]|nr:MAG: hypothetical protein CVV21_06170 [Candidatus Goldiibacteriota bacterium HGW-Goldbacteria-1]
MKKIKNENPVKKKPLKKIIMAAPCGMNCAVCMGYLREKNHCVGCRGIDDGKIGHCAKCLIYNCKKLKSKSTGFCYSCPDFPCARIKHLEKRYTTRYQISFIDNLMQIKEKGIAAFERAQKKKWKCPECGGVIGCHTKKCIACGAVFN